MAFRKDSGHCYRVPTWDRYPWLEHRFGTRHAPPPEAQRCATLKQIHSAETRMVAAAGCAGQGDAMVTNQPDLCLNVRTADCVPLLMVDPINRSVAAVHAGWRGTAAEIATKALVRMNREFGTEAGAVEVAIGPAIGPCCYEVGPEVAARFQSVFPERTDLNGRTRLDLPEANRRQLIGAGVLSSRIFVGQLCTCCNAELFYSFRRDGQAAGRLYSAIALR